MLNVTLVHLQQIQEVLLLFDFTLQREKKNIYGNFIILNVTIEDKRLTSVNLYMSNKDLLDFFNVVEKVQDFEKD